MDFGMGPLRSVKKSMQRMTVGELDEILKNFRKSLNRTRSASGLRFFADAIHDTSFEAG
jgi:hypothetical protein